MNIESKEQLSQLMTDILRRKQEALREGADSLRAIGKMVGSSASTVGLYLKGNGSENPLPEKAYNVLLLEFTPKEAHDMIKKLYPNWKPSAFVGMEGSTVAKNFDCKRWSITHAALKIKAQEKGEIAKSWVLDEFGRVGLRVARDLVNMGLLFEDELIFKNSTTVSESSSYEQTFRYLAVSKEMFDITRVGVDHALSHLELKYEKNNIPKAKALMKNFLDGMYDLSVTNKKTSHETEAYSVIRLDCLMNWSPIDIWISNRDNGEL